MSFGKLHWVLAECWVNADVILGHRLRRWPNITAAFSGLPMCFSCSVLCSGLTRGNQWGAIHQMLCRWRDRGLVPVRCRVPRSLGYALSIWWCRPCHVHLCLSPPSSQQTWHAAQHCPNYQLMSLTCAQHRANVGITYLTEHSPHNYLLAAGQKGRWVGAHSPSTNHESIG